MDIAFKCLCYPHSSLLWFTSSSPGPFAWWCHQMETFSALLALCAGNSPVTGEFPSQRPVTRRFGVFYLRLNKRLSKQPRRRWFETTSSSLWRHCNVKRRSCSWRERVFHGRASPILRATTLRIGRARPWTCLCTKTPFLLLASCPIYETGCTGCIECVYVFVCSCLNRIKHYWFWWQGVVRNNSMRKFEFGHDLIQWIQSICINTLASKQNIERCSPDHRW